MRLARHTARFTAFLGALSLFLTVTPSVATPPKRPPPVTPVQISAPEALLWRIYTLPNPYFDAFINPKVRPDFYTSRIHDSAEHMERCYLKKYGMDFLDIDYIVPGNDYDIRELSIKLVRSKRKMAVVQVRFNRSGLIHDPIKLDYYLKLTPKGWRIDNVEYEKHNLAEDLSGDC